MSSSDQVAGDVLLDSILLMGKASVVEASLLRLGQIGVLLLHDSVAPYVVELGQHKENDVEGAETRETLVRSIV